MSQLWENKPAIRWGIIGVGDVTEVKSGPPYRLTEGFELVAVMRRDAAKAHDYARRHGVPKVYTDAGALIDDPEVDAVYVATPPDSHHKYALMVAAAGKPCCIEKPMAPSYAECVEIEAAFAAKQLPLFVAYYRRTQPRFLQVKAWLDAGAIGAVRHISWLFCEPPRAYDLEGKPNWRTEAAIAPGGYFDDLASHGLDLFAFLLGNFQSVTGYSGNQQGLYTAKDAITACWTHTSGATGMGSWHFGTDAREDRVEIMGASGTIRFSVFKDGPVELIQGSEATVLEIAHPAHVQAFHVALMRDQLFGGAMHPSTGKTAVHTAWVMDRVLG